MNGLKVNITSLLITLAGGTKIDGTKINDEERVVIVTLKGVKESDKRLK